MLTKVELVQQARSFAELQRAYFRGMPLTALEVQILTRTAHGDMAKDIARLRGTSLRTIEAQTLKIRMKLGARSKAHAVAMALARGLIQFEVPGMVEVEYPVVGSKERQSIKGMGAATYFCDGETLTLRTAYLIEDDNTVKDLDYYAPIDMDNDEASRLMQERLPADAGVPVDE